VSAAPSAIGPTGCAVEKKFKPSKPIGTGTVILPTVNGVFVAAAFSIPKIKMFGNTLVSQPSCSIIGVYSPYMSSSMSSRPIATLSSNLRLTSV
jgi:hypothetical protein